MNNFVMHNVKTKDNKQVMVGVQCRGGIDRTLANNIESYINTNMDMTYAISKSYPCYNSVTIIDSNDVNRNFISCFIMTWDGDYTNIIDADLVSFIEK